MYPTAVECGVPVDKYWDLTLLEIKDILEAFDRRRVREKKERIDEMFTLATVIANRVALALNGKATDGDYLWPWHFYPDLFEDKSEDMEEQRELAETMRFKAHMDKRVAAWNKRFEEEHKDDS